MLESISREHRALTVVRYANPREDLARLRRMGIDPQGIEETLQLLRSLGLEARVEALIDASFKPWNPDGPPFGKGDRFCDGNFPVCYTALDEETARDEIIYHQSRRPFEDPGNADPAYRRLIELTFSGTVIDLRPQVETWPDLVNSTDYSFCQSLGREASSSDLDAFLAASARRTGGTNVPVFKRSALADPRDSGVAVFRPDPRTGQVSVVFARREEP